MRATTTPSVAHTSGDTEHRHERQNSAHIALSRACHLLEWFRKANPTSKKMLWSNHRSESSAQLGLPRNASRSYIRHRNLSSVQPAATNTHVRTYFPQPKGDFLIDKGARRHDTPRHTTNTTKHHDEPQHTRARHNGHDATTRHGNNTPPHTPPLSVSGVCCVGVHKMKFRLPITKRYIQAVIKISQTVQIRSRIWTI